MLKLGLSEGTGMRRTASNRTLIGATIVMTLAVSGPAAAQSAPAPTPIVYVLEQLQTGPIAPEVMERMKATHTLLEVETLLKVNRIAFAWRMTEVSTDQMKGNLAQQIAALPPKEVFVIRQGDSWLMSSVVARR
jgi:hypothetical protein